MGSTPLLDAFTLETQKEFPNFKLIPKAESALMRFINVLLLVISFGRLNSFMTSYSTTLGTTVYTHGRWPVLGDIERVVLLRHERVHMTQAKRYTRPLFSLLYLFVLFPIGFAYFRMKFEREAYEESIRATIQFRGISVVSTPEYKARMLSHFTSADYLWMWPFKKSNEAWFVAAVQRASR